MECRPRQDRNAGRPLRRAALRTHTIQGPRRDGEGAMRFASSRLPLVSTALGGLLIVLSFVWGVVVPKPSIGYDQIEKRFKAQEKAHAATSPIVEDSPSAIPGEPNEAASGEAALRDETVLEESELRAQEKAAEAVVKRALFWRETAPMLVRYVGVALAALGSILYPIQLLIRQEEAEQEEEDSARVVD